jgi:hypothetical protein
MKRIIAFFIITLSLLCASCKNNINISDPDISDSDISDSDISVPGIIETETTIARRKYAYFEEYFPYMNDLIEGKFISYKIENGEYYYTFEVLKDYRETGLRGEVTVRDTPAHYSFAEDGSLHGITGFSTYDVPFSDGVSYLLALRRYSSTFNEEKENFFFTDSSLIIPAQGYEKSAVLYGTPLREHIKTQEALEAFDNGRLAEYILEAIRDNPRLIGTPYTKITTLKELLDFSSNVFKVKVNGLRVYSSTRDRISGYCTVEDVLKGECEQSDVEIVFPMGQVEEGADYIVAVRGSGSFFVASTMNSVFDCSEYDAIKELIDNE